MKRILQNRAKKAIGLHTIFLTLIALIHVRASLAGSATWNSHPTSSDWNTASNWTPNAVPNGPSDSATFESSTKTLVTLSADTEVDSIIFNPGASAFTITQDHVFVPISLTISGAGIMNNSGVTQSFLSDEDSFGEPGVIEFLNSASAGSSTAYVVAEGAELHFYNSSGAGSGSFTNAGGDAIGISGGLLVFHDTSKASSGLFVTAGGAAKSAGGGLTQLLQNATADNGVFFVNAGAVKTATGGIMQFSDSSSAVAGNFTVGGAASAGTGGGTLQFLFSSTAASATFTIDGASASGGQGGLLQFLYTSTAGAASLTANGGVNSGPGGSIQFVSDSDGGVARVEVFGNGNLDVSAHATPGLTIGSIEGDGGVFLGANNLMIGANALSATFSGVIEDGGVSGGSGGSIGKIGGGTLTLSGVNTYTGGTTVSAGMLVVSNTTGSGTGTRAVNVNGGTLGGKGIISGAVTVNSGAFLAPAHGTKTQSTLTIQSALTFNSGSTYTYTFKAKGKKAKTDKVIANGVTINSGANVTIEGTTKGSLKAGTAYTLISNTSANPISGTFSNLADSAIVNVNGNNLQASYEGGDGNDLTLTVVP